MTLTDRAVIEEFLRQHHPGLSIDEVPDEIERSEPAIDAIAGHLAIEHTSVDRMPEQRAVVAKYQKIVRPSREAYRDAPGRVYIAIPYQAVLEARRLEELAAALHEWLNENLSHIEVGEEKTVALDIDSSFRFKIRRPEEWTEYDGVRFRVGVNPEEEAGLVDQIVRLLRGQGKLAKLVLHKTHGRTTVLLVESSDFQLMNREILAEAFQEAEEELTPLLGQVDEIWFADTMSDDNVEFWRIR